VLVWGKEPQTPFPCPTPPSRLKTIHLLTHVNNLGHHCKCQRRYAPIYSHRVGTVHSHRRNPQTDDKVILRFTMVGTHTEPFLGIDATGRSVRIPGMTILRFEDQKCVERWSVTDSLSLLAQLGAFPWTIGGGSGPGERRCPFMGNKAVERGLALGIPGACAEPVQYAELGHRPDCELLLRPQIQIDG